MLELVDIDGDRSPDQFSYSPAHGGDTQDFGFIFDLNKDGKVDYIVFYQGTMLTMPFSIVWTFYHWIDSDYDGKIDIWVYPDVDLNEDKALDPGVYAWVYDTDRDGGIDKGEYLGQNIQDEIAVEDGVLNIKRVMGEPIEVGDRDILEFANKMLDDINAIMD
jgi:hypothetical protein